MEPLLTCNQMRKCDRVAIEEIGIPGIILMENAGRGVVQVIEKKYGVLSNKSFLIVCGKGNNGGDGFVVARHLFNFGARVYIALLGKSSKLKGDTLTNYKICRQISKLKKSSKKIKIVEISNLKSLKKLSSVDFIIDAIFGTGFSGEVTGLYKEVINHLNSLKAHRISIDIPSGVNADNGEVVNTAIKADLVVTFGFKKIGLLIGKSINYINDLKLVDISIPPPIVKKLKINTYLIEKEDIKCKLPIRFKTVHKYNLGKLFVLAGSKGYTGAAALVTNSAMRMGVGAVILGIPEPIYPILAKKLTEVITRPIDSTDEGSVSIKAYPKIKKLIEWAEIIVIGCGLSLNKETEEVVIKILSEIDKPLLIDADALTIMARNAEIIKKRRTKRIILTPHLGEFSRLIGLTLDEIEKDKVNIAQKFAKDNKITLVLKGAPTIVVSTDGKVIINSTGNPGMATIGVGDVLAGMIAGLWAQGMSDFEAAYTGVYLHGLAGDMAREKFGTKSLMAQDIQNFIPNAIRRVENSIVI